jgi:hypothetical protein
LAIIAELMGRDIRTLAPAHAAATARDAERADHPKTLLVA